MEKTCQNCAGKTREACYECFIANEKINWKPPSDYIPYTRADKLRKMSTEDMALDLFKMFRRLSANREFSTKDVFALLNEEVEK